MCKKVCLENFRLPAEEDECFIIIIEKNAGNKIFKRCDYSMEKC